MTEAVSTPMGAAPAAPTQRTKQSLFTRDSRLARRNSAEVRFKAYGLIAIGVAALFLVMLLFSVITNGYTAFQRAEISVPVTVDQELFDKHFALNEENGQYELRSGSRMSSLRDLNAVIFNPVYEALGIDPENPDDAAAAAEVRKILLGKQSELTFPVPLRDMILADTSLVGETIDYDIIATVAIESYLKGRDDKATLIQRGSLTEPQFEIIDGMDEAGILTLAFNSGLFLNGAASNVQPQTAGLYPAIIGTLYMMAVVFLLALPIGVAASIYLEEFAPKNRMSDIIEVNINNLAAVPSIVFGILGLAVFIDYMGMNRGAPIVGGLVLTLMTLPTIIIATRAALKSVPPSIRSAALGLGASKMQMVFHHVLPLAAPGILTGTIIGIAQAMGETAPLLMIGMVGFFAEPPSDPFVDQATALPAQVYQWASTSDPILREEKAAGAIIVLLVVLMILNITAVLLRRRFERRW